MDHLIDLTGGRLKEMVSLSRRLKDPTLVNCLKRLRVVHYEGYGYGGGHTQISNDFAPQSFYFERFDKEDRCVGNGGIIYHGPHDNGGDGSAPTFSVNVSPTHGWQTHT